VLSIASFSYLIAITRREQVAQILGKPVYVISDVAVLPLSSQHDANKAITAAAPANLPVELNSDESSDSDVSTRPEPETPLDLSDDAASTDIAQSLEKRKVSGTRIAEDVIARKGQYGRFASQWFSKKGWGLERSTTASLGPDASSRMVPENTKPVIGKTTTSNIETSASEWPTKDSSVKEKEVTRNAVDSTVALLPKILRSTKMILSSKSFYFSYDINITRRLSSSGLSDLEDTKIASYDPLVSSPCTLAFTKLTWKVLLEPLVGYPLLPSWTRHVPHADYARFCWPTILRS
jgi:SacI homology domain